MARGERVGVLMLDLDGFQMLNDSFGHEAGNEVLSAVAKRLQGVTRQGDLVARMGADEFAVVCERVGSTDEITSLARRFLASMRAPFVVHDQQLFLGAHVGIGLSTRHTAALIDVVRDADTALNRAKADDAPFRVFDPEMRESSRRLLATASDLRHAVARRELRVEYQPIVELPNGQIVAFEALARWDHPRRGSVRPVEFIPAAEKAGLIAEIGEWVLHQAVAAAVRWGELGGTGAPRVSVNVSPRQLQDPDFLYVVTRCLEQWDLPYDRLILEITESAVMDNIELANESLRVLSGLGVRIAIDDFGAGASSLSQLKQLSWVDILKIDRSFMHGLGEDDQTGAIVGTVIALARALDMHVVAEGVESELQSDQLSECGCDCAQGWHFGRAVRPRAAESLVVQLDVETAVLERQGNSLDSRAGFEPFTRISHMRADGER